MAGHEWGGWFERQGLIGQICDIRVQNLQVEREVVQKRTFTRWMNLHLQKCEPAIEIHDLFQDIQDGRILMVLLEELSGCKLLHRFKKSSHRIFRLNNIAKVLSFLEERNVKLISIDAADVADGNASIILGLIWNIILFFQIKELTGNIRSQFPSSSNLSSIPTSSDSDTSNCSTPDQTQLVSMAMREHSKTIKKLLQWVQKRTRKYGVAVRDFGKSWTSGHAFLAVIKSIDPSLIDMRKALLRTARDNLEDAFRIALYSLGIPRFLEPEDVTINPPDEQSIITYVSQFLEHFPGIEQPEELCQRIERSVSVGRLNLSDRDTDTIRNGVQISRVKGRSYMFQRDSVSEYGSTMQPLLRPAAGRTWLTEDIPSSVVEDAKEPVIGVLINSTSNITELSYTQSPTGSSIPESVNTDSVLGNSLVSLPDSWMESDTGVMSGKFCGSQSNSSLCDSGTVWDVYHAIPVEVTTPIPSIEAGDPDDQLYNNMRIYSGRTQGHSEDKHVEELTERQELNLENHNQYMVLEQVLDESKAEIKKEANAKQIDARLETSCGLHVWPEVLTNSGEGNFPETDETNQSCLYFNREFVLPGDSGELVIETNVEEFLYGEHESLQKTVDVLGNACGHEAQMNVRTESLDSTKNDDEGAVETQCQTRETRKDPGMWIIKDGDQWAIETLDVASKDVIRDYIHHQQSSSTDTNSALVNINPTNQEGAPSIPQIPINNEPEPMDLFYPDKEEPMFTEPPYIEIQSWPSVLSVSALTPAPSSENLLNDQTLPLMIEDLSKGVDLIQGKVIIKTDQETDKASESQEMGVSPRDKMGGLWSDGFLADGSNQQSQAPVGENTESVRGDTRRTSKQEETQLYLLLLLWLLLYCFWVLPQMDLKALPSLLLNTDY